MARTKQMRGLIALACVVGQPACTTGRGAADEHDGQSTEGTEDDSDDGEGPVAGLDRDALGPMGLRRLSRAELSRTLTDLVGPLPAGLIDSIPGDAETPFDNDYTTQDPSPALIDGLFAMSAAVADHVLADPDRRATVLGCTPSGPDDAACLRAFATSFARRALRRPISPAEGDGYAAFISHGVEEGEFDVAATMVIEAVLMDSEFVYRIETGELVADQPSMSRLDDLSMATRLSYLLWGTGPDEALLLRAEQGELSTSAQVREVAEAMLADRRGLEQLQRFHAMWLDYDDLPQGSALELAMRLETDALVERVVAERRWSSLLTLEQSYLSPALAVHYDLGVEVFAPGWVDYPDARRAGILSHGAFLAVGEKFGDTSPVERGKAVWTRLLCEPMPPPPPDIDSGVPPAGDPTACKPERYDMSQRAECAACHTIVDPIGFGLENYGPRGQWRTHEPGRPQCSIEGRGEVAGLGAFAGAPGLGALLADSGRVHTCAMRRLLQFSLGRAPTAADADAVDALARRFETSDDMLDAVLALASSDAFRHRVVETNE
ncbi:MAG: DUF1588 domain-containing protein [Deltaproteobacteria bacterium]|nr:DUF1588 domain-containing protein [Deltaproteobacteria bacterium]